MAYASPSDIAAIYGVDALARLSDPDPEGEGRENVAAQALAFAAAQIDSYLLARYALPLPSTPDLIKMLAVDIAIYRMAQDHARLTDEIAKRYDDAIRLLKALSEGRARLPLPTPSGSSAAAPDQMIVTTKAAPHVFDRADLRRL